MRPTAGYWINKLQLTAHIEGGAFREVYRSAVTLPASVLSPAFTADRSVCTSIYFLLQQGQFSAFHRIKSDELWHFYYGDPLTIYEIGNEGTLTEHKLGSDAEKGEQFQCVVKAGHWFGARVAPGSEYALAGCTVAPGFDFADFELAEKEALTRLYPQHAQLIAEMVR